MQQGQNLLSPLKDNTDRPERGNISHQPRIQLHPRLTDEKSIRRHHSVWLTGVQMPYPMMLCDTGDLDHVLLAM